MILTHNNKYFTIALTPNEAIMLEVMLKEYEGLIPKIYNKLTEQNMHEEIRTEVLPNLFELVTNLSEQLDYHITKENYKLDIDKF